MHGNNYVQLIGLLIVVGFSIVSALYRWAREQQVKNEMRARQQGRQTEILRTGRDPGGKPLQRGAESQSQRELAIRREAQLAELRRRAHERSEIRTQAKPPEPVRTAPRQTALPPIRTIPGSMGPTVPQRAPARGAPLPKPRPQPAARPQPAKKPPVQIKAKPAPQAPESETPTVTQLAAARTGTSPLVNIGAPRTSEEWRRAIIANEIMMPPLALREGPAPVPF